MHLNIDFSDLEQAAQRMGATGPVDLVINCGHGIGPFAPIEDIRLDIDDFGLEVGIEGDLSEVKRHSSKVLTYQNRQVVVYIQDQGQKIREVLDDGAKGYKVHVAECKALQRMRRTGHYNRRYVATNKVSGEFYVTGRDEFGRLHDGLPRLRVCQYCLGKLNYKDYNTNRERVFRTFDWSEFFDTYATHFTRLPGS